MRTIVEQKGPGRKESMLDFLARQGARKMLTEALDEEVTLFLERRRYERAEGEAKKMVKPELAASSWFPCPVFFWVSSRTSYRPVTRDERKLRPVHGNVSRDGNVRRDHVGGR